MTGLTNFQAFLAGLLLGIILPILIFQIRKQIPALKTHANKVKSHKNVIREKDIELKIRQHMILKCQANHLLSFICPLNEVYEQNNLMSKYYYAKQADLSENEPALFQFFPNILDFPELSSIYPSPRLTLQEALQGGCNIAVMGEIGSGKTALLSHFCSESHFSNLKGAPLPSKFPLYFNIHEIGTSFQTESFFDQLTENLCTQIRGLEKNACRKILENLYEENNLLLIIDALDELNSTELDSISDQLGRASLTLPKIQFLTAIGQYYTSSLIHAGFSFCTMPFPDKQFRKNLRHKIISKVMNEYGGSSIEELENLLSIWDHKTNFFETPGQITLNLLSSFFGDNQSNFSKVGFLQSLSSDTEILSRLSRIANKMSIDDNRPVVSLTIKQLLSDPVIEKNNSTPIQSDLPIFQKSKSPEQKDNFAELVSYGVFRRVGQDLYQFASPMVFCELRIYSSNSNMSSDAIRARLIPVYDYLLKYSTTNTTYIREWLSATAVPYQSMNLTNACRHLLVKQKSDTADVAKNLFKLICDPRFAFSLKLKLFMTLIWTFNGSIERILGSLNEQSRDKKLIERLIAASLFQLPIALQENAFAQVVSSPDSITQSLATIWYLSQPGNQTSQSFSSLLQRNNESFALLVMEIFAFNFQAKADVFSQLRKSSKILVRKAVVHGLRYIKESWAIGLLNEILMDDDQWIVRDSVSHALESPWENKLSIPYLLENPNQSTWLLQQASMRGVGVPANQYPEELILDILKHGDLFDQRVALEYLGSFPTLKSIKTLQHLSEQNNLLQDFALTALNGILMQKKFFDLLV